MVLAGADLDSGVMVPVAGSHALDVADLARMVPVGADLNLDSLDLVWVVPMASDRALGVSDLGRVILAASDQNPDSLDLAGAVLVVWVTLSLLPLYSPAEIP